MTDQHRKQLQRLMSDPNFAGLEAFFNDYMLTNFATASIRRQTEFDTIWYAAEAEGAKRALTQFMRQMEVEAGKVELE